MSTPAGERREALVAAHGQPSRFSDARAALDLLGRGDVDPAGVMAWVYRDQAAADAFAASNLEHSGVPSLGTTLVGGGVLGVMDIRVFFVVLPRTAG